jgi:hypothetical protein
MTVDSKTGATTDAPSGNKLVLIAAWLAVGLPLLWGVAQTIKKALVLFR